MIGKVQQDSFPSLRIRIDEYDQYEPSLSSGYGSPVSPGESLLPRDCHETFNGFLAKSSGLQTSSPTSPNSNSNKLTSSSHACGDQQQQQQQTPSSRYKTEMCRPYQEHGECKYGEKCQFAHGTDELRTVNRHPKYKTDMCRTYHSVGFCPYGPRCHFIHALDELRPAPASPDRKTAANNSNTPIKQLPMFGGGNGGGNSQRSAGGGSLSVNTTWSFPDTMQSDMKSAVNQLNNFFNVSVGGNAASQRNNIINNSNNLNSSSSSRSSDSSRSGSFCSDLDSPSSTSPPPSSASSFSSAQPRLPIFSRLA